MNHKMLLPQMTGLTLALVLLVACGTFQPAPTPAPPTAPPTSIPPTAAPTSAPTSAAGPGAGTGQGPFADPFTYCAAVGTMDAPDERYTGPKVPEEIVGALRVEAKIADDAPTDWVAGGTSWRCMDGKVWGCFVGANLPCDKADTSQTPSPEIKDFCAANPTSDTIPAAVTGHGTIYEWRCTDGKPEIVKQVFETDAQGFVSGFWYQISPAEAAPSGGS